MFENHSKSRIWMLAFSINDFPVKSDLSGNIVWLPVSGFQKHVEWDFLCDFQTLYTLIKLETRKIRKSGINEQNELFHL